MTISFLTFFVEYIRSYALMLCCFSVSNMEDLQILFPDGHFESEQVIEEQQMVLMPLPKTTLDHYYHNQSNIAPSLHEFTPMRDDGENAMHFFSNPNFFFEHWRLMMQHKAEEEAKAEEEGRMVEISVSILFSIMHTIPYNVVIFKDINFVNFAIS